MDQQDRRPTAPFVLRAAQSRFRLVTAGILAATLATMPAAVVVVEDVITTGGSTREVIEIMEAKGAVVLAAGSIIDRSGGAADVGAPRTALETLQVEAWAPDTCPLCATGSLAEKPGSRPA